MLANRIPLAIHTAKSSATFKKMNRVDAIKCQVTCRTEKGVTLHACLVCWQDQNMVYCLSNATSNLEFDECSCRGSVESSRFHAPFQL
jgi:hypothetical protein